MQAFLTVPEAGLVHAFRKLSGGGIQFLLPEGHALSEGEGASLLAGVPGVVKFALNNREQKRVRGGGVQPGSFQLDYYSERYLERLYRGDVTETGGLVVGLRCGPGLVYHGGEALERRLRRGLFGDFSTFLGEAPVSVPHDLAWFETPTYFRDAAEESSSEGEDEEEEEEEGEDEEEEEDEGEEKVRPARKRTARVPYNANGVRTSARQRTPRVPYNVGKSA